jgi:putative toxin-antitoxin system antitoxin component (TIGR02293 family)
MSFAEREQDGAAASGAEIERAAGLLGGAKVLRRQLREPLDVHELLSQGLPGTSLSHLVDHVGLIRKHDVFEAALGMSPRTFQRVKLHPRQPLSREQSGRVWKFAEILAKATGLFGTQGEAEEWLDRPAIGLEQRRPVELLATPAGAKLVEELLDRLAYGVYA